MEPKVVEAYVGLGSNFGDRESFLQQAVSKLDSHPHISVIASSSIFETEPVGYLDQDSFLNMVIQMDTSLEPEPLLDTLLAIEKELGRTREIRWGPRTIDLDLLLYGRESINTPTLTVPHPRMTERAFVMVPLVELVHRSQDALFASLTEQLEKLEGKEGVTLWKKTQLLKESGLFAN
ncbi:2-amino-4-hydroxy-6-hydroxymethyldihydropteridine diphosphokinase [Paenibacillus larvae]|uniref:2-amino-4-hydroxy-6-hydroxymethyldihydropteridine diphosphokinase n=3 Tax=Paenibacillus larvae TaxID=1464 RepID=V9WCM2_9BACL|nr:2-amino-4-hydroxy-6-hydroxymethyldihydropteridine diphosphokinase [Paenibacillus larvae]AQT85204.1 2-amino-4-hydroxy-6-hydroxymethyldihydropteridine diphosphokinase [Paenibacillus larvae subsp. pulvifaciens]AHD07609.1 2-amino-4-hydroxy-6-hydroxymethyldihydropteridine pyrophosphokinase FolK [Paenibacillus larvae subsp. larvae DSM 25430]AQR78899.1 2-amino-4-hydroxy-6-hydroxymethyldihydropteridine diphosphokinase [Paenibacillus larvae subsp. larvae]AQZ47207.1 2-amino-4-hydroxy-6-hydroxymethyldi